MQLESEMWAFLAAHRQKSRQTAVAAFLIGVLCGLVGYGLLDGSLRPLRVWNDIQTAFGDIRSPQATIVAPPQPLETTAPLTPAASLPATPAVVEQYDEPKIPPDVPARKAASLQKVEVDQKCPPSKTPTKSKVLEAKKTGPHSITIDNGTSENAVVRLRSTKTGKNVAILFVPRNSSLKYPKVPNGDLAILFAFGDIYSAKCRAFSGGFRSLKFDEIQHFATTETDAALYYQELEITLHTVEGGNAPAGGISEEEFLKGD